MLELFDRKYKSIKERRNKEREKVMKMNDFIFNFFLKKKSVKLANEMPNLYGNVFSWMF